MEAISVENDITVKVDGGTDFLLRAREYKDPQIVIIRDEKLRNYDRDNDKVGGQNSYFLEEKTPTLISAKGDNLMSVVITDEDIDREKVLPLDRG